MRLNAKNFLGVREYFWVDNPSQQQAVSKRHTEKWPMQERFREI